MNKIIAVLVVIVLITLAMLFFCIGFFTGSTTTPGSLGDTISAEIRKVSAGINGGNGSDGLGATAGSITPEQMKELQKKLGSENDIKSAKLSDKIIRILASAGHTVENFSEIIKGKTKDLALSVRGKKNGGNAITVDSLLREMAAPHSLNDACSYERSVALINAQKAQKIEDQGMQGKKIVFIGYFHNNVALQIQKLLAAKGYKTHIEMASDKHNCFIFCGPFKKDETAATLLKWLQFHDFDDARVISLAKENIEENIYDAMNNNTDELPENTEIEKNTLNVVNTPAGVVNARTNAIPTTTPAIPRGVLTVTTPPTTAIGAVPRVAAPAATAAPVRPAAVTVTPPTATMVPRAVIPQRPAAPAMNTVPAVVPTVQRAPAVPVAPGVSGIRVPTM